MAARDTEVSSDSESGNHSQDSKTIMPMTPADSTPPEDMNADSNEIGMSLGCKNLYSGKEDKHGRFQWQTTIPEDLGKPAEDAESEKWAIVVRKVKSYYNPKKVVSLHSIAIQSPLLKKLLKTVLAGYPGVTVGLKRLEFSGRFEPLIHRWAELKASIVELKMNEDPKSAETLKHAELLHELIIEEFSETIESALDLKSKAVMTYEHLWTLFQPGSYVYSKQDNQDRILRLHSSKYGHDRHGNPVFWISCQYVDFDGSHWGTNTLHVSIPSFEGTRVIISFPAFPLHFHSRSEELRAKLIERGAKVEQLAGSHYRAYNGAAWRMSSSGEKLHFNVNGRIVIDAHGWNGWNPNYRLRVREFRAKDFPTADGNTISYGNHIGDGAGDFDAGFDIGDGGMPSGGFFANEDDEAKKRVPLNEEQKLICTPIIRGYSLKDKVWLNFFVEAVEEIVFSDLAYDSLVLPKNHKDLILGFTAAHSRSMERFDDVVEGKGRGIILLLCGPPGVGKTLTAESIAEKLQTPLFMLTAGDLGLEPRTVETKLRDLLELCARWNAILLLDEADVFLEERSLHELERNKLVSIFLRLLEYYKGIMFLTTNRVRTFDAAFRSRIHISIEYPELDTKSRKKVWSNFLQQHDLRQAAARDNPPVLPVSVAKTSNVMSANYDNGEKGQHLKRTLPHVMTDQDIDKLARLKVNGREIKNVLKIAQLLASQKEEGFVVRAC